MNRLVLQINIKSEILAKKTASEIEDIMKDTIAQELVSKMMDEIENGTYMKINPVEDGYVVEFEVIMCEREKFDKAIGETAVLMSEVRPMLNIANLLSPINQLFSDQAPKELDNEHDDNYEHDDEDDYYTCENCGDENPFGSTHCENCGQEF
jgi:hypothetical protein